MKITADDYNHDWSKTEVKTIILECHPYPECKPEKKGYYLVGVIGEDYTSVAHYSLNKGRFSGVVKGEYYQARIPVYAWAEMPESLTDGTK